MISHTSVLDFMAICQATHSEAIHACKIRILTVKQEANKTGTFRSSRTLIVIDKSVSDVFNDFAPKIFAALQTLSSAEPILDAQARQNQLRKLLEQELRVLGTRLCNVLNEESGAEINGLLKDYKPTQTNEAIERAVTEYLGRIGLSITTQANTTMNHPNVVHNPVFHGPVGSYQLGDHNTVSVTQSVVTQVTSTEVKAALDELIQILQGTHTIPSEQQSEVIDILEQVKTEAEKEHPNKLKLSGLIGSVRDILEGLAAAPAAWETIKNWYAFIISGAIQSAPVIAHTIKSLGV